MRLKLTRPLVFFDIESTGLNIRMDRIVEIALLKTHVNGRTERFVRRLDPERTIPPEVVAIHGITNEAVQGCPTFRDIAVELLAFISGADLAGFGISRFDVPLLCEEFRRSGLIYDHKNVKFVDAQRIFHQNEPRNLTAAMQFYCESAHIDAHGAEADALATIRVLEGQFQRYDHLPCTVEELDRTYCPERQDTIDPDGRLRWQGDEVVIAFGAKNGTSLRELVAEEPTYLEWMLRKDFSSEAKAVIRRALAGDFPCKAGG